MSGDTVYRTELLGKKFMPGRGELSVSVIRSTYVDEKGLADAPMFRTVLIKGTADRAGVSWEIDGDEAALIGEALIRASQIAANEATQ